MSRTGTVSSGASDLRAVSRGGGETSGFDAVLVDFRTTLEERLGSFLAAKRRDLPGGRESLLLVDVLLDFVRSGGKRLRPALTYHAYRACGGRDEKAVQPLAMATEMLHTYLLIHDDIMDRSDLRRGRPTAHVHFRDRHRAEGWPGDAAHFGRSAALLAGDLVHSWALELYRSVPVREELRPELDRVFAAMCEEVVSGQFLETVLPFRERITDEELLEVVRLKSGKYSVQRPVEMGAVLAGAPGYLRERLHRYGRALGEAFQLQDDILGTFGNPDRAGKPGGTDLVEGKMTFLVHHALQAASPERADHLRAILADPDPGTADLERAREILVDTGAVERVQVMVEQRFDEALSALESPGMEEESRAFLTGMVDYLRDREW